MVRLLSALTLLLAASIPAAAQPADCPAPPPGEGGVIPLWLDLNGMPGVPRGRTGQVGVAVPVPAPGAMACVGQPPPPPGGILSGPQGDVLAGPPARDLLRGPVPRVEVQ
jgi:hypothetical protein